MKVVEKGSNAFFACKADTPLKYSRTVWNEADSNLLGVVFETKDNNVYFLNIIDVQKIHHRDYECEGMANKKYFVARVSLLVRCE